MPQPVWTKHKPRLADGGAKVFGGAGSFVTPFKYSPP